MGYLKKSFGENIKFIRKTKNMTQEHLAELIEIDRRQLARIEAGESFATAETIERISEKLGVSVKILFDIENIESDKMTLEVMDNYKDNRSSLSKIMKKIALSNNKTEFIKIAAQALERKNAREKLRGLLLGLELRKY